jgi:hypothetical protein
MVRKLHEQQSQRDSCFTELYNPHVLRAVSAVSPESPNAPRINAHADQMWAASIYNTKY